ncbi:MAG: RNA polymerase sigma-70 factor [Cyclobacteriaceae bacterium]|nr:RNA polymerase sigma-70 factor [Cyclobacteriaceae bacterium]
MDTIKLKHLISRIVNQKDERAFSTFFDYYHTRFISMAMLFVHQHHAAEEIVSDVFLTLLNKKQKLLDIEKLEGYMFVMVKNHSLNYIKSKSKSKDHLMIDDVKDYLTSDYVGAEESMINTDVVKALYVAIQKLPPKRRLVFKMVKEENMSYKEAAEILEISERTVEVHLKLAIQDLRLLLQGFYEEHRKIIPISKRSFLMLFL